MKAKRGDLFQQLEPPAGGAESLQRRLGERASAPMSALPSAPWRLAGAAAALLLFVLVLINSPWDTQEIAPGFETALESDPDSAADSAPDAALDVASTVPILEASEFDRLLGREFEPYELTVRIGGQEASMIELASSNPKIRIYDLN